MRNAYEVLGVSMQATKQEIVTAFRRIAKQHHPDKTDSPVSLAIYKEAVEAFRVLGDPEQRRAYDRDQDAFGSVSAFFEKHPVARSVMTRMLPAAKVSPVPGQETFLPTQELPGYALREERFVTIPSCSNRTGTLEVRLPTQHHPRMVPEPRGRWIQYRGQGETGKNGADSGDAWLYIAPQGKDR